LVIGVGDTTMEDKWVSYPEYGDTFKHQSEIVRYFVQGIPFAAISIGVLLLFQSWFESFGYFSSFSNFVSLMLIVAILLTVVLGALNSFLAAALWDIRPRQTCTSFAGQGLMFVFFSYVAGPLFLVFIFSFVITLVYGIAVYVVFFIVLAFIGGYLGKNIAAEFEGVEERVEELASVHDRHITCPYCGAHTVQGASTVDGQRGTHCSACGEWFGVLDKGLDLE
jgi:hypothetical protein